MTLPAYSPYTRCQNARCFAPIHDDDARYFRAEPYCEGCYEDMLPGICWDVFAEMVEAEPLMRVFERTAITKEMAA